MQKLIKDIKQCELCKAHLPLEPRPVVQLASSARLMIIGQAPGIRVHQSGIPWNDPSGERLRQWLNLSREQFYDEKSIAIMPMGFCYPGTGKSGDLPPRPECATTWHRAILEQLPQIELTLLIGQYAQQYYLHKREKTLTATVQYYAEHPSENTIPLPHPSPRNNIWLKKNPWFIEQVIPRLQARVTTLLNN